MWTLTAPWWEFVLRAVIVYGFLIALLRLTGMRQVGQLSPFDLVLLLILSNAVQNAMNAGDNSVLAGLILATTLVGLNYLVSAATVRSRRLEDLIDGQPQVLVCNGELRPKVMRAAHITRGELDAALRRNGCVELAEVRFAILETNGGISVVSKADREPGGCDPVTALHLERTDP